MNDLKCATKNTEEFILYNTDKKFTVIIEQEQSSRYSIWWDENNIFHNLNYYFFKHYDINWSLKQKHNKMNIIIVYFIIKKYKFYSWKKTNNLIEPQILFHSYTDLKETTQNDNKSDWKQKLTKNQIGY